MKITANINYRGFSLTSVDAKTLKMRGTRFVDLPSVSMDDWVNDRERVDEIIQEMVADVAVMTKIKYGQISHGQYDMGTQLHINAELVGNDDLARRALDIEREHKVKSKKRAVLEDQVKEIRKDADKKIKALQKENKEAFEYSDRKLHRLA